MFPGAGFLTAFTPLSVDRRDPEAYSEPCQTSKMECFAKMVVK